MLCLEPLQYILRLLEFVLFLLFNTFRYICLFLILAVLLEWKFTECLTKHNNVYFGAVIHLFDSNASSN